MSWNNGLEKKKFIAEQIRLCKEYKKAGMSDADIKALFDFDLTYFNSRRRFHTHTQPINPLAFDDDSETDEEKNPLFLKFMSAVSTAAESADDHTWDWWTEEIENPVLAQKVKSLSQDDLEILTLWAVIGLSQQEIALEKGVSQQSVSKKITRLKKFLKIISG